MKKKLFTVNCHMYTEASDFLGGLRPARRSGGEDDVSTMLLCPKHAYGLSSLDVPLVTLREGAERYTVAINTC